MLHLSLVIIMSSIYPFASVFSSKFKERQESENVKISISLFTSNHPGNKVCTKFAHAQMFMNNSVETYRTNSKIYAYYLYKQTAIFTQNNAIFLNYLWCCDVLIQISYHLSFPPCRSWTFCASVKHMHSSSILIHKLSGEFRKIVAFSLSLTQNIIANWVSKFSRLDVTL